MISIVARTDGVIELLELVKTAKMIINNKYKIKNKINVMCDNLLIFGRKIN